MKIFLISAAILFLLGSCSGSSSSRCERSCTKNFNICLLLAQGPNALGVVYLCQSICDTCQASCYSGSNSTTPSRSRSRSSSSSGHSEEGK